MQHSELISQSRHIATGEPKACYVYMGVLAGEIAYIGKGSGQRYKHLNSGQSQIPKVKEATDSGKVFDIYILCDWLPHDEALRLEKSAIAAMKPVLNTSYC